MCQMKCLRIVVFEVLLQVLRCASVGLFHEGSKITLLGNPSEADYFGYSVTLTDYGLLVGAPKANNPQKSGKRTGLVYLCDDFLKGNLNTTCNPLTRINFGQKYQGLSGVYDFFIEDMWFGATIVPLPHRRILICAPRWYQKFGQNHYLANGACFVHSLHRNHGSDEVLLPLQERQRQATITNGTRKEYGEYGNHLNFYAYAQVGMSGKAVGTSNTILGAPGLLQWTGGIVDYSYFSDPVSWFAQRKPVANPYAVWDLGPDEYFGYSVDSVKFLGKTTYVGGAPRSKSGYGQVLIFLPPIRENDLTILASLHGPHLGSYFGASLLCSDVNNDSRVDILVGAPNYVKKDGSLHYDQGAVFVYLGKEKTFDYAGYVSGSLKSGSRFGTAIADLGDVDSDGYNDVAIGAPWEDDGSGAVYIYRGSKDGLMKQYSQRITASGAKGFGMSISQGYDIDKNNCSDLAVGAFASSTTYIFRCVPTIDVYTHIKVPYATDLPRNATNYTALFCLTVPSRSSWKELKMEFSATITIDPEGNRAQLYEDDEFTVSAKTGENNCDEKTVMIKPTANLAKPITMTINLKPIEKMSDDSKQFLDDAVRLSEDSVLHSTLDIQLTRDCGEDLICHPWLVLSMRTLSSIYVPGTDGKLGAIITVVNEEEPAYEAQVYISLPLPPKRVPATCELKVTNMTCDIPSPLHRHESVSWEIELEYNLRETQYREYLIEAKVYDPVLNRKISDGKNEKISVVVSPRAVFNVSGRSISNATYTVSRDMLSEEQNVSINHYFEVRNFGPSDLFDVTINITSSAKVDIARTIKYCAIEPGLKTTECKRSINANETIHIFVPLRFDLSKHGQDLERNMYNATATLSMTILGETRTLTVATVLILEPAPPIWPLILGSVAGLLILAAIVYGLYRYGFFSRTKLDDLKRLQEDGDGLIDTSDEEPSTNASRGVLSISEDSS